MTNCPRPLPRTSSNEARTAPRASSRSSSTALERTGDTASRCDARARPDPLGDFVAHGEASGNKPEQRGVRREMATFALIHGGGDVGWYWHLVQDELRDRGHEAV